MAQNTPGLVLLPMRLNLSLLLGSCETTYIALALSTHRAVLSSSSVSQGRGWVGVEVCVGSDWTRPCLLLPTVVIYLPSWEDSGGTFIISSSVPLSRCKFFMSRAGRDAARASRQVKSRRQRHWVAEMGRDGKNKKEIITLSLENHESHLTPRGVKQENKILYMQSSLLEP